MGAKNVIGAALAATYLRVNIDSAAFEL